jgi:multicomponent Na+:H+ antiporter subunit D
MSGQEQKRWLPALILFGLAVTWGSSFILIKKGLNYYSDMEVGALRIVIAFLFFIPAFSLGGIPPLSGFWAKFAIVKAGLEVEAWISITAALLVGVLTLYSMTKIWAEAFWKAQPDEQATVASKHPGPLAYMVIPIAVMSASTVLIGLFGAPMFEFSERAAAQLMNPQEYISAVLTTKGEVQP